MAKTNSKSSLVKGFRRAGAEFAYTLRMNLGKAVYGTPTEMARARGVLRKAAQDATTKMTRAGSIWLNSPATIEAMVILGQRSAATQVGIKFGGPNTKLIQQLKLDTARDLSRAAHSTTPFLETTLRKATVIATEQLREQGTLTQSTSVDDFNKALSKSLLSSAQAEKVSRQSSKKLLEDLGLDKGDRVLFMSGRTMEADAYAKLVTRTRTMEALNKAKAAELTANGYQFIETSEHDGVEEDDICYFLQGKVWALAPNEEGIPVLPEEYGLPPWHPNCAHTFGAWQPKFEGKDAVDKAVDSHADDDEVLAEFGGKTSKPKGDDNE